MVASRVAPTAAVLEVTTIFSRPRRLAASSVSRVPTTDASMIFDGRLSHILNSAATWKSRSQPARARYTVWPTVTSPSTTSTDPGSIPTSPRRDELERAGGAQADVEDLGFVVEPLADVVGEADRTPSPERLDGPRTNERRPVLERHGERLVRLIARRRKDERVGRVRAHEREGIRRE